MERREVYGVADGVWRSGGKEDKETTTTSITITPTLHVCVCVVRGEDGRGEGSKGGY
jgi:hypothetical protein